MENTKKVTPKLSFAIMCVFFLTMTLGSITPIMNKLYEAYANIPTATVTYVNSVTSIVSIPASILIGIIAGKKLSMKKTVTLLVILFIIGGCAPAFIPGFGALLVMRGIYGFAMGGLSVLGNPLVTTYYPEDKRAGILGMSTFVAFGGNIVLQYVGAFLADIHWSYCFLTHAIAVIPLVCILMFLPEAEKETQVKVERTKNVIPAKAIAVSVIFSLVGLLITPLLFMSSVYAAAISESSVVAATVTMCYSIGSLLGGFIFNILYKVFHKRCIGIALLLAAVGMLGAVTAKSIPILCLSMLIAGSGYCAAMPAIMMIIGLVTPGESVAFATAIMMALMNFMSFLATPWLSLIGNITGDITYMPVYIGAALMTVLAVITMIVNLFPAQDK